MPLRGADNALPSEPRASLNELRGPELPTPGRFAACRLRKFDALPRAAEATPPRFEPPLRTPGSEPANVWPAPLRGELPLTLGVRDVPGFRSASPILPGVRGMALPSVRGAELPDVPGTL